MTFREELIRDVALAIARSQIGSLNPTLGTAEDVLLTQADLNDGEAALDAILAKLSEPSEEMVEAGVLAVHQSFAYDDATVNCWNAMLSTLKKPA